MNLQDIVRSDMNNVFGNFPELVMTKRVKESEAVLTCTCNALQSFINLVAQTETGVDLHVNSAQVSINANDPLVQYFNPLENDIVTIKDLVGNDRKFIIKTIDRDRTIGIWLANLEVVKDSEKTGVDDAVDELIKWTTE